MEFCMLMQTENITNPKAHTNTKGISQHKHQLSVNTIGAYKLYRKQQTHQQQQTKQHSQQQQQPLPSQSHSHSHNNSHTHSQRYSQSHGHSHSNLHGRCGVLVVDASWFEQNSLPKPHRNNTQTQTNKQAETHKHQPESQHWNYHRMIVLALADACALLWNYVFEARLNLIMPLICWCLVAVGHFWLPHIKNSMSLREIA